MKSFPNILLTLFPLIGVVIGAAMQYLFSRAVEDRKNLSTLRNQAYVDYLRSIAQSSMLNYTEPHTEKEKQEVLQLELVIKGQAADSKSRIAIYGSRNLIKALAKFEKNPVINSKADGQLLLEVVKQMRSENHKNVKDEVLSDLEVILFRDWDDLEN